MPNVNIDAHSGPCFSLSNRIKRSIWSICYYCLFRYTPRPMHQWRCFILKLWGARLGKGCHIYPSARIWAPWNLVCSDKACIADCVNVYNQDNITIGRQSVVSQGTTLCTGSHDFEKPGFPLITKPIIIENVAWIAAEAFVHPGVIIEEGAVIGARSVVRSNMPAWSICSGFPCKPIKKRITQKKE